jgi:triacylglycerol lipase
MLGFDRLRLLGVPTVPYFRGIPAHLRRLGCAVVITRVPPTGSIEERGRALAAQVRRRLGARACHIVGHSMGGLDARFFITHLDGAARVLSLTTLGTPHRGSSLADAFLARRRHRWYVRLAFRLGLTDAAVRDLRRDAMARFNDETPDVPQVRYFSVAGEKPIERMDLLLRPSARALARREGPNDSMVSVASAAWGEARDVWPCDHLDMIGWRTPIEGILRRAPQVLPLYTDLVRRLAEVERAAAS